MQDKKKMQHHEEQNADKNNNDHNKSKKILPQNDADTSGSTNSSMSEGDLSNNRFGRGRARTPHDKTFVTGSDDDGQSV
jgi:hypothetical protein